MKVVILAGGRGTRLAEFTDRIPKPLVPIDRFPILFHIMNIFSVQGFNDFVILTGYRGELISDFFVNFKSRYQDIEIDMPTGSVSYLESKFFNWRIKIIHTGQETMTGGRLLRAKNYLLDEECFFLTYGDGLANVNLDKLLKKYKTSKTIATVSAVNPPSRFGRIAYSESKASSFSEKSANVNDRINGGFFVFTSRIFDYLQNDQTVLEEEPLYNLANEGQLSVFEHNGYWQCMDTVRDLEQIRRDLEKSEIPWLKWNHT